jgi:Protein of unknown function (DUF433)
MHDDQSYCIESADHDGKASYRRHPDHRGTHPPEAGAGETWEQILDAHPRLTREAIQAALAFAAEALRADVVYPTPDEAA